MLRASPCTLAGACQPGQESLYKGLPKIIEKNTVHSHNLLKLTPSASYFLCYCFLLLCLEELSSVHVLLQKAVVLRDATLLELQTVGGGEVVGYMGSWS